MRNAYRFELDTQIFLKGLDMYNIKIRRKLVLMTGSEGGWWLNYALCDTNLKFGTMIEYQSSAYGIQID